MLRQYAKIQKELKLRPVIGVYGNQIANGAQHLQEKVNKICLIKQFIYRIVANASWSCFEAHVGLFRLLRKGIFDPYVL